MHQPENKAKTLIFQDHWDMQNASEKRKSAGSVLAAIVLEQCLKSYAKIHVHHVRIWAVKAKIVGIQVRSVRNCHNISSESCRYVAINFKDFSNILH